MRLQAGKNTILVDPCLTDEGARSLRAKDLTKDNFTAIVISRATPEHCHIETLKKVDKSVLIIANSKVCKICRKLGFTDVFQLNPKERCIIGSSSIEIVAFASSKIGTWSKRQNAYVFYYGGESMLYEPTGDVSGLREWYPPGGYRPISSAIVPMLS